MPTPWLALVAFFTSGFAALLYQVIWQRMLAIFSGADVYSATVIVSAFMGGLGAGHIAGGHVADRVSRRTSLILFGAAEMAIAVFGVCSAALYYGVLYQRLGQLDLGPEVMGLVLFVGLLWPTFFMGASLPLLARAVTDRIDSAAATVGALYGFNTLGAASGALVATWVLLPQLGLEGSLRVGAALNLVCGVVLLPLVFGLQRAIEPAANQASRPAPANAPSETNSPHRLWPWALIYGFAGFVALSYEIVWFRLLGVMMKSTAFTFGTLLTLYLAGIGLGAVAGSALAARVRLPRFSFFALQAAAGLVAGVLLVLFIGFADDIGALRNYFGSYEPLSIRDSVHGLRTLMWNMLPGADTPVEVPANFLRLYIAVPLFIVIPPTFLMGCAFPCLQRVVQTDLDRVGRHVGTLLVANVAGSILGTVFTGWFALSVLGTAWTLKLLVGLSGVFAVAAALSYRPRLLPETGPSRPRVMLSCGAAMVLVLGTLLWMPGSAELWSRLHGTTAERMIFAEDSSGLSVIKAAGDDLDGPTVVLANGVGQSVIPYGDAHTALGALPVLIHPDPRQVAIIGLGSGDTLHAAGGRPGIERITGIEIVGPQLETLRALAARNAYGGLRALLDDPRVDHVVGDGRAYLMRTHRRYDVIEADALRPTSASSGNLYSDAYFTLVKNRLAPGGLAATWVPTHRVHDTFVRVFPYAVSLPGILLGSSEPIDFDATTIAARAADARVRDYYRHAGIDIEALVRGYIEGVPVRFGPDFDRRTLTDLNTDLFPKDEFDLSPPR
jgi:predicted membrane-bound spermidine synthase